MTAYWLAALLLFACSVSLLLRTYSDSRYYTHVNAWLLNSDLAAPAELYDNIVLQGYSLRYYQNSAATFVFPDIAAYFAVRSVVGSTPPALCLWHGALFALLIASAGFAITGVTPPAIRPWVWPSVLLTAAAYAAGAAVQIQQPNYIHLFFPMSHFGAAACSCLGFGLVTRYVRADTGQAHLGWVIVLAVMCGVSMFSDRLFGLYFAAPMLPSLIVRRMFRAPGVTVGRILVVTVAIAIGCGAGMAGLKRVPQPGKDADPLDSYIGKMDFSGVTGRAGKLAWSIGQEVLAGNFLVAVGILAMLVGIAVVVFAVLRRKAPGFYPLFALFSTAALVGIFLVTGTGIEQLKQPGNAWAGYGRYFAGPEVLGLFGWAAVLAAAVASSRKWVRAIGLFGPAGIAAMFASLTFADPPRSDCNPLDPYPEYVRKVDEICRRYQLTDGIAGFWQARQVNIFSRAGIQVRVYGRTSEVEWPFVPYVWISNAETHFRNASPRVGKPRFQFVIANADESDAGYLGINRIRSAFGPPAEEVPVADGVVMMVYNRPSDTKLAEYSERCPHIPQLQYRMNSKKTLHLTGASFFMPSPKEYDNLGFSRIAEAPRHRPGCMAFGPYIHPRAPGRYHATFHIRSSAESVPAAGHVDVFYQGSDALEPWKELIKVPIPPGCQEAIRLEFDITPEMVKGLLCFRTTYYGAGRVELESVDFGRVKK